MDIVIIGTGNTATILGKKFKAAGHQIVQVFGRNSKSASELAYELDSESTNYWSVVNKGADIYLVAVSDMAIEEVLTELQLPQKPIVHTAASVPINILKRFSSHYGVFYPLQSLKSGVLESPEIPILIDANDQETKKLLKALAQSISSKVIEANDEERAKLHLAAVVCNNFVNHLYHLVHDYCNEEGLNFKLLLPLIQETTNRLDLNNPSQTQTGPAIRNDSTTIKKHLTFLDQHPRLRRLYEVFTQSIKNTSINSSL